MPHLTVSLRVEPSLSLSILLIASRLATLAFLAISPRQKPELGAHAEVRNRQQDDLLEHRVPAEFVAVVNVEVELLQTHREEVHHISDVQVEDPVVLLDAEDGLHVALQGREVGVLRLIVGASGAVVGGLVQLLLTLLLFF